MSFSRTPANAGRIRHIHLGLAACLILVGFWLRMRGADSELWLDEIWSLNIALSLDNWHEAFWKQPKDNNHPLNTWWLYMMGAGREAWVYHFLSVILSTASIIVTGWLAARRAAYHPAMRMMSAIALVAILYPFANFGSEARGYGPMMLFALLAYGAVEHPDARANDARWGYGLAGILGLVSHLGMLPILFALSLCFGLRQLGQGRGFIHALNATVRLNAPFVVGAMVFVAGLYYGVQYQGSTIQYGGTTSKCFELSCFVIALDEITRFMTGGFGDHRYGLHSGFYLISVIGGLAWLGAIGNRRALPLALILLGVPALFYAFGQPVFPHGRYFFAVFIFVPLLVVEILGELFKRGRLTRFLSVVALLTLLGANGWAVKQFLDTGRGQYKAAVEYIVQESAQGPINIGTEMMYQLKTVMDFNQKRYVPNRPINIVNFQDLPQVKPEWLISVTIAQKDLRPQACVGELLYRLEQTYAHWGMAGTTWGLYRLKSEPAPDGCAWLTENQPN
ncbi:MAG: hypothetical protein COB46_07360 [Rhodospirillaceae bacterium]|nr:MAG: hypothetical protein COB46_07360 [Rhodospirillaceae bacterium]